MDQTSTYWQSNHINTRGKTPTSATSNFCQERQPMLTQQQVQEFDDKGYLLGSVVLNQQQVQELRDELTRVIQDNSGVGPQPVLKHNMGGNSTNPVMQIVNIWHSSDAFRALLSNQVLVEEVAQLTRAKQLRVWHDQIQFKPAGIGGPTMWHQDSPLWAPVTPQDEQVTAWLAIDDVDPENGCMSMVPGSHKWGQAMHTFRGMTDFNGLPKTYEGHEVKPEVRPVKAGQVHYHHGLAWHGSPSNLSNRPRRAIAIHFMTDRTVYRGPEARHVMSVFITAKQGEQITGLHFPLVYENGKAIPALPVGETPAIAAGAKLY
jgi:ectoine hydroxylase-related dioxygenase (phytanoyl-CoA dioxygenase family)